MRWHRRQTKELATAPRDASQADGGIPGLALLVAGLLAVLAAAFIVGGAIVPL